MAQIEEHKALKAGTHLRSKESDYTIESILGMGGFGITYKATTTFYKGNLHDTCYIAIKEFFLSDICMRAEDGSVTVNPLQQKKYERLRKAFHNEAELLSKLPDHEGLIKVNECFDANNTSYYVMEYLEPSLNQKVQNSSNKRLPENEALDIIRKIGDAVAVLHSNNRLHLDIKPANIMFKKNGEPCLIDFGNSRAYKKNGELIDKDTAVICSSGYSPQEQYNGINTFSPAADIYALGATLLYILTGKDPLPANEMTPSYIDEVLPKDTKRHISVTIHKCFESPYNDICSFLTALREDSRGGSETEIIRGGGGTGRPGIDFTETLAKIRKLLLPLTIIILIACGIFWGGFRIYTSSGSTDSIPIDTPKVAPINLDSIKYKEKEDSIKKAKEDSIMKVKKDSLNKAAEAKKKAEAEKKQKENPKPVTLNLGWGTWNGKIVGGKPYGHGKVVVKTEHAISPSVKVYPGDVIERCEFNEYGICQGDIKHKGKTIPFYVQ